MREKGILKILAISVILAIVASSVAVFSAANFGEGIGEKGMDESGGKDVISIEMPPFIGVAGASESEVSGMREGTSFLEEEAGISAKALRSAIPIQSNPIQSNPIRGC